MCIYLQYLAPKLALSRLAGRLANSRLPWFKNFVIRSFIKHYDIDLSAAVIENAEDYPTFNEFFTRHLKPHLRPIASGEQEIACPADGFVSQIGHIDSDTLLQAKGKYFNLTSLLGSAEHARLFENGEFGTFYLSPRDYHRVHMPLAGKLQKTIYIPGKLFSVNQSTAQQVDQLFARNERLVCLFETATGPMAVILVGAMLVGSITTVWGKQQIRSNKIETRTYSGSVQLEKGAELGYFTMGSTVIVLFGENKAKWSDALKADMQVKMGQCVGTV